MFGLKKKIRVFYIEKGEKPKLLKTKIVYKKDEKKWYVKIKRDSVPAPENIFEYIHGDTLIVVRRSPNMYDFLKIPVDDKGEIENMIIPPEELYTALIRAQERKERNKSAMDKLIPIISVSIIIIVIGVFMAIAWGSVGDKMTAMASTFDAAMAKLNNITATQMEITKMLTKEGGGTLIPR